MTLDSRRVELEKVMEGYPVALDPDQVAAILGITRRTVDKLLDEGKIQHFVINPGSERKLKRVTKVDLVDYMLQNHIK
jgi:excisionase family DNA binding protein